MAIDWIDVGFNILIGLVALFILCYWGFKINKMIREQMNEKEEEELDNLLKTKKKK